MMLTGSSKGVLIARLATSILTITLLFTSRKVGNFIKKC